MDSSAASSDGPGPTVKPVSALTSAEDVYTIFGRNEKRFIVFMASLGAFFSPLSGNIYYPALNSVAADLHVSGSLINLTITSYMVLLWP